MKEQTIINQIKAYLVGVPNLFFWKTHGGQFGTAGIPDIIICYRGKFIALEVKAPGREPTALQKLVLNRITDAGGIATVVRSVTEVRAIVGGADG